MWIRTWSAPAYRALIFCCLVWLVRDQHRARLARESIDPAAPKPEQIRAVFPEAARLRPDPVLAGGWAVEDAASNHLGYVVQTAPASDRIIGFSGPNNTLVAFGTNDRIIGLQILSSGDTREHLEKVLRDPAFMTGFNGLTWNEAKTYQPIDAVSGATLTSLAIVEGVIGRLSGQAPSLRFPDPLTVAEARQWFPDASQLLPGSDHPSVLSVRDGKGNRVGAITRTSPAGDHEMGYQGPTDVLLALDPAGEVIQGLGIRRSYDNQPYVRYVQEDDYFLAGFKGMPLRRLVQGDLAVEKIEGVSGATMTSKAIARGLIKTAHELMPDPAPERGTITLRFRDIGTVMMGLMGLVMAFTRLRGNRAVRVGFQLALIGYLGFWNGDMVSQAFLAGWAKNGLPWRLAPGLVVLAALALTVPLLTGRQVYCHQICPHGAAQQLLRPPSRRRVRVPSGILSVAALLPTLLLVWVILVVMLELPVSLVAIEPFDAYIVQVAGWSSLAIALAGLAASLFVPMAYCRYGCPTGVLLNFLRRRAPSHHFMRRDWVALFLLLMAIVIRLLGLQTGTI